MLLLVPTMLGFAESLLKLHGKKLSGINLLISCGDRYNPKMDNRVMATFGVPVIEGYGITECSPALAVNPKPSVRKIGIVGPNLPMNCSYPEKLSWRNSERRPFLPCFRGGVPKRRSGTHKRRCSGVQRSFGYIRLLPLSWNQLRAIHRWLVKHGPLRSDWWWQLDQDSWQGNWHNHSRWLQRLPSRGRIDFIRTPGSEYSRCCRNSQLYFRRSTKDILHQATRRWPYGKWTCEILQGKIITLQSSKKRWICWLAADFSNRKNFKARNPSFLRLRAGQAMRAQSLQFHWFSTFHSQKSPQRMDAISLCQHLQHSKSFDKFKRNEIIRELRHLFRDSSQNGHQRQCILKILHSPRRFNSFDRQSGLNGFTIDNLTSGRAKSFKRLSSAIILLSNKPNQCLRIWEWIFRSCALPITNWTKKYALLRCAILLRGFGKILRELLTFFQSPLFFNDTGIILYVLFI